MAFTKFNLQLSNKHVLIDLSDVIAVKECYSTVSGTRYIEIYCANVNTPYLLDVDEKLEDIEKLLNKD